jgi:thiamine biosynthesis protein ThiS
MKEPAAQTITITANGQPRDIAADSTIADLLHTLQIAHKRIVAQLDGEIVPRETFDQAVLHEGSKLELITMVGGG